MLADLHQGGYKASPLGRVHRRSSLSRSDDVVCHNFTSDRIKGAARPTRKILLTNAAVAPGSLASLLLLLLLLWGRGASAARLGCRCTGASSSPYASPRPEERRPYNRSDLSLPAIWLSWKSMCGRVSVRFPSPASPSWERNVEGSASPLDKSRHWTSRQNIFFFKENEILLLLRFFLEM